MLSQRDPQHGFSLLEVMIALVIISVGFLATARMQIEALRGSQGSYFRTQANFMVREMADRMRANPEGIRQGEYNALVSSAGAAASMPACVAAETVCSPNEIAQADLTVWSRYLHATSANANDFVAMLPSGENISAEGRITLDGATGVYTVTVSWSEMIHAQEELQQMSVQVYP